MSALKIFVSSTCVDLGAHREQMRLLLTRMGYEPIMSDYSDVLYDPRKHTHTSCIREVSHADMVVLLIGARFGGTAVPEALSEVDVEKVRTKSSETSMSDAEKYSITQLEIIRAIELGIPLFVFVDSKVYSDNHTYSKNKNSDFADRIVYSSVHKPETAKYIFEFINFISHMSTNNAVTPFSNFSEVEDHLLKQWSGLFQTLLREAREGVAEARRSEAIFEQIQDLKAAVLQSVGAGSARDVARSVLRYRGLAEFLISMRMYAPTTELSAYSGDFDDLLSEFGVFGIEVADQREAMGIPRTILALEDGTTLRVRVSSRRFDQFAVEWAEFRRLDIETKEAVLQAVADASASGPRMVVPYSPSSSEVGVVDDDLGVISPEGTAREPVTGWTEARLELLRTLWSEGKTASEIAEIMGGVSRNAVIGKAHRLGLKSRPL
jgi:GcrA cell cycle regulator/Domain of unknown function (DUF4062)